MITSLKIKNYTLIENLDVKFNRGLSTITGETGAGKSILLDALELVLGKRADIKAIKNQNEKCLIEVEFDIYNYNLQFFFTENNIDYDNNTILRREILPNGKSRSFINDIPANLEVLSELGKKLVDIHSQFQTLKLNDKTYQFYILDTIGKNQALLAEYQNNYKQISFLKSSISLLKDEISIAKKSYDYNIFLLDELNASNLKENEQKEIEQNLKVLNNSEGISYILSKSYKILNDENVGILNNLNHIKSELNKYSDVKEAQEIYIKISSLLSELNDVSKEVSLFSEKLEFNPEKQKELSDRLDLIFNLQKKHNVKSIKELLEIKKTLEIKTLDISTLEANLSSKEDELKTIEIKNRELAESLYINRFSAKTILEENIIKTLRELGMEKSDIEIKISKMDTMNHYGFNDIEFLFSANIGIPKTNITKSVSGGELSRIMLAIKKELSNNINLPTIIFDEIDTGVSGNIAHKMGEIMQDMSKKMQIIAITHLPQVASKGNAHYKVEKKEIGENTISEIFELNNEERIIELAKMISGENITQSAISHAKEMLK